MKRRPLLATVALLAGCAGPQDYMVTAGAAANRLAALGWFALLLLAAVSVVTWILVGWVAVRRRGSFDEHAPPEAGGGQRWILVGGVAIPVAVLSILFISTLSSLNSFPLAHAAAEAPDIRIIGHQWWFDAQYLTGGSIVGARDEAGSGRHPASGPLGRDAHLIVHAPTEIHVPVGVPVELELETRDVIHSFWVPKLHGKVDLIPGQKNRMRIEADQPGVYQGECAEYCGVQHAQMRLVVVAQPADEFRAWLEQQRHPAAAPATPQAQAGQKVFERAACAVCHTVRGTPAQGRVGPELTHVASRSRIAGGAFPNTTANLEAWIIDAQSLKPGAAMPSLRQFSGAELRALVAYLQSLR